LGFSSLLRPLEYDHLRFGWHVHAESFSDGKEASSRRSIPDLLVEAHSLAFEIRLSPLQRRYHEPFAISVATPRDHRG
jgi:hypothetical protein